MLKALAISIRNSSGLFLNSAVSHFINPIMMNAEHIFYFLLKSEDQFVKSWAFETMVEVNKNMLSILLNDTYFLSGIGIGYELVYKRMLEYGQVDALSKFAAMHLDEYGKSIPYIDFYYEENLIDKLRGGDESKRLAAAEALDKMGWEGGSSNSMVFYHVAKKNWAECKKLGASAIQPLVAALKNDAFGELDHDIASTLNSMGWRPCRIDVLSRIYWQNRAIS